MLSPALALALAVSGCSASGSEPVRAPAGAEDAGGIGNREMEYDRIVVELKTGGGNMADAAGRTFRLHRGGRLEEVLIHHRKGTPMIVRRDLPLASGEARQLVRTLADAGFVGSTEASILAGLQQQDSRIERLLGGADCASTHLRIWSDQGDDREDLRLETDLRFECLDGYDRFEWIEGPIPAIRKVERRLLGLSLAAGIP